MTVNRKSIEFIKEVVELRDLHNSDEAGLDNQWTYEDAEYHLLLSDKYRQKEVEEKEVKVYKIDLHIQRSKKLHHSLLTDDEFIDESEKQGSVYSLEGFQKAFNTNELDSSFIHSVIRIF